MAFIPLTDEEKRILSGEEPEEKSPDTGTGGLFGGINVSSIPEVADARERIEKEAAREPFEIPENPLQLDPSPSSPRLSAYKMLEDLPEPVEPFQGAERLNMTTAGGGTIVELSPREKAIAEGSQGYSPSTLFLGKRFREAYSFSDPEAYAEDVKRSMTTGIPFHMMGDPEVRQDADMRRSWETNRDGLEKLPPALKNWLAIPGRMEIARDDISTLAQLAEILKVEDYQKNTSRVVQGYRRGEAGAEIARISWRDMQGIATPEELARIPELEQQAALNSPMNPSHMDDIISGLGYMFGQRGRQLGGAATGAIKYGLAAAGTAALFGQAGPQAALMEEIVTVPVAFGKGASIGWNIGGVKEGFILETGSAFHEFSQMTDENGEPLPRELAILGALLYGGPASLLEMASFSTLTKWIPGVKGMFSREGVGMLLKTPSVRNAMLTFLKEYGMDLTFESSQEAIQQLWQIAVGEVMKNRENERRYQEARTAALEGDTREGPVGQAFTGAAPAVFKNTTLEEALAEAGDEFFSSMKTFALSQLPGSSLSFMKNISKARQAQQMQQRFAALGDVLTDSKLAKRFGPAISEVIGELTKNGPIEEVGINARVFSETLEQAGENPVEVAKELGISEESLNEARTLDGDVWVPTGIYAEKVAATELHKQIAPDIRLGGPEELTAREAETVFAKQQEDLAAAVAEAEAKIAESGEDMAAVNEVKTSLKEQLDSLGIRWLGTQASDAYSTLWANMALQASKRWGMTVKEWTDRVNLTVEREGDGAVRLVGKKKSAAGVSVLPGMSPAEVNEGPVSAEGGLRIPLDRLRPSENIEPGTLVRAKEKIAAVERGEIDKRSPLTVWDRGDGTYSIADGNHTYTALKEAGAADVPVVVERIRNRNVSDITSLYTEAKKSEPEFNDLMADLQGTLGGELVMRPEIKGEESVKRKVVVDYEGDYGQVVDVLGGTLVFDTERELFQAVEALKKDYRVVRIKDRWTKPGADGYRDFLLNVRLSDGYVGELQVHHRAIAEAKHEIGHDLYKLVDGLKAEGFGEEQVQNIQAISRAIYKNALETGQAIPASLKASDLDTLRDLINHLNADSGGSFLSEASGMILQVLGITSPSSKISSPDSSLSSTKDMSFSVSIKNSNVLTDVTSGMLDGSSETEHSTAIIPDVTERSKGKVSEVVTGAGTVVETQFRLVEADDLVASNTATFAPNEAYPAELQPRKRDRAANVAQVEGILSNLDPERLGESRMASDGAPIVGPDMVVESGNGRVLALQLMYGRGEPTAATAKGYRSWLSKNAGKFGLLQAEIDGMKAPVLVRERTWDVDRASFVKEANVSSVAAMSASETARSDAERMSEGLLSIFDPSSDLLSTENIPFIREFLAQVVPSAEWGSITTSTGALSKAGVARMQNALAARAYGDSQLLERMAESEDDNIRNITRALIQAAPALSVMEDRITRGALRKGYSLSSFISAAVNQLSILRERGETVGDYLSQQTMFADTEIAPEAKNILAFLDKNKRSPRRIANTLTTYARLVENQGDPNQQNLFGEKPLSRMDLWTAAESSVTDITYEQDGMSPSQRLMEDAEQFGRSVDSFLSGDLNRVVPIKVMTTPLALNLAGARVLPITIPYSVLQKVMEVHTLSPETIKSIPESMADPVMIFKSETVPGRLVVMLDLRDQERGSIVVPLALEVAAEGRGGYTVNMMTSAYYRQKASGSAQDNWFVEQIEKGNLAYMNNKKSSRWFALSGQIFPEGRDLSTWTNTESFLKQNIPTEADLVNLKELNPDLYKEGKGTGPQGRISFGDGEVFIQLTPKANRSTFLHETGHLFLWDLDNLVKSGRADAETLDHWRTLEGWWKDHAGDLAGWIGKSGRFSEEMRARFSGAEGEKIVREALEGRGTEENVKAVQIAAQEYFAQGFEQYTMEGKSPSVELRRIFDLFRKWLTKIYSALKGVPDVELSDEVRQVMDRMVASEEAIELSELKQKSDKAASAMLGKGVDDITAREYRQAAEKAAAEAKSRLLRVLMKEISEEGRKRVEEARRKAEGQILPELLKIPAYRVYDKLVTWLNGTGEKLSTVGLTAEQVKDIPEGMYSADGEIPLNMAADMLGLESEGELLTLLAEATAAPLGDVLKARVDQAVAGVESAVSDPERMRDIAEESMIMGAERMRLLSMEREILARKIRQLTGNTTLSDDRTLAAREAAMRQQAKAMILGKSMRESVAIHKFLAEAKRAGRQAFEAALAGRLEESLEAKDREMLYTALYLEGKKIREEAEKQQRYLKKFWAGRQRLKPLIGEENLVQIQALLGRYGFQKEDETARKIPLHDWLTGANAQLGEDLNEQGAGIPVADWLWKDEYAGKSRGWKELTVAEFRELHEAVKAIEHFGRSRNKLIAQEREQDLHKWKDKLQQSVISVFGKLRPGSMDPNSPGAGPVARFLAAHDRIEFLLRRLDGFKDLGTAWELFFKPVADAEAIEIRKMKEAKKSMERIFSVYTKEERRAMRAKTISTMQIDPDTGKPLVLSRENVLAMLLNWGALQNREEVVFGYGFDRTVFNRGQGWIHYADMEQYWDAFRQGEREVERLFSQVLTEKDYAVAQAVWDLNESYWADVSAMVHSLTGVTPEKVEHLPVRGPNGAIYAGGYYHLAFKPESNLQSFVQSERADMKALYEPQGMFAMTRTGHTKARHTGPRGARLLRLELNVEVEHLRDVIHDLYFRPVVRDLNRLLNDQQVQQIMIGSIGFEAFKQFKPWVHGLANAYRASDNYGEKIMQKVMGNTSAAILGYSMSSALNQLFGWSTVMSSLGVRKTMGAMLNFWSHPHEWKEMRDFAFARSPYLQDRVNSFDRDVKAAIEQITANPVKGQWSSLQETFFTLAGWMDMGVSLPTWMAAYDQGMLKWNGDEQKAIDYADWVVRSTQNTGAAKDLASIQRGSPMWKAMTMFYTAFGSIYNQAREQYFRGHGVKDLPRIAGFLLFQFVLPALLGDILNRRGPSGDEDPEEIVEWIFTSVLQEMAGTMIIARDVFNAATSGFDYRLSPIADAGQSVARLMMDVGKTLKMVGGGEGPDWEKVAYHAVEVAGTAWGIPSKQILRTTRGLTGMVNDPDWTPIDLLLRKPKK